MKIAFILGAFCSSHRPLNYNDFFSNGRGVSGSDLGISRVAQEFSKQGHDVSLFTSHEPNKPDTWEGVKLYHLSEKKATIKPDWDAIISWSEPDEFRDLPTEPLRICSQQLNGFTYCKPGFDDYVDVWASPSNMHMRYHIYQTPHPEKWVVIPDGCDPDLYTEGQKVPGRVVFTSSPDRGLHWLLQEWQNIKAQVPEANLRIFYHFSQGDVEEFERGFKIWSPSIMELGQRTRYFRNAIKKLKPLDVEHVGSVSRDQLVQELNQAMVLGYPTSVVSDFCEGFGCSVMEACAAGCVPVISDVDAFGDLYGGIVPMIKSPVNTHMGEFTDLVVKMLRNGSERDEAVRKCKDLANKYTWKLAADKYIDVIQRHPKYKKETISSIVSESKNDDKQEGSKEMQVFNTDITHKTMKDEKISPFISIVVPINRVGGLDVLFESLKNQSFQDFELILVDAIYKYRKDVVAEKAKEYGFLVKHTEPIGNTFPISNYCRSINTGLCQAAGKIVYFTCDNAYLPKDVLLTHAAFHTNNKDKESLLMLHVNDCMMNRSMLSSNFPDRQYGTRGKDREVQLLLVPEKVYVDAHNEWSDRYAEDLQNGILDKVLWSIFDKKYEYDHFNDYITSTSIDTKFNNCSATNPTPAFHDLCCLKNDSFKLEFLLDANGMEEEMDGSHGFQDSELARRLKRVHRGQFFAMNTMPASIINTRYYLEPRKIVKGYNNHNIIVQRNNNEKILTNNTITRWKQEENRNK